MKSKRLHTKWLNYKNTRLFCVDFSGCEADDTRYLREIHLADQVMASQPANSMLVSLDLSLTRIAPEIAAFVGAHAGPADPIRKLAVLGISDLQRFWLRLTRRIAWPLNTRFFADYESAKAWLASEMG